MSRFRGLFREINCSVSELWALEICSSFHHSIHDRDPIESCFKQDTAATWIQLDVFHLVGSGWEKQGWPGPLEACNLVFLASCMMEKMGTHPRWGLLGDHVDELSLLYIFWFLQNGWTWNVFAGWKFSWVNSAGKILRYMYSSPNTETYDMRLTWGEREFFEQNPVTNLSMYFSRWNCNIYIGRLVLGGVLSKWREPKIRFEKYKWIWIYFILYIHILHNYDNDDDYDYVMMLIMIIQPLAGLVPGWELESKWMFQQRNCWIRGVRNSQNSRITSQTTMALAMK